MYAYIDETGNTGKNLFDKNQPLFITAALVTKKDYDTTYASEIVSIAKSVGSPYLHANELGLDKIDSISKGLIKILKDSDSRFFISSVDKLYLATTKLVDTLFDAHENKAVPWHVYNIRPLRLLLVFEIAKILTEDIAIKFWDSLIENNEQLAYHKFVKAIKELRDCVNILPDERSKKIIYDAIDWAVTNPENIYIHTNAKSVRSGNLPNMVVFPNLLRGIDQISKEYNLSIKKIIHDRQNQFQNILKEWHELLSNAAPDVISWIGEEEFSLRCVEDSHFIISSSDKSVGIQTIDLVLWLFKKHLENKPIGINSKELLQYVFDNAYQYGLSFEIVGKWLFEFMEELYSKPLSEEGICRAKKMLQEAESNRHQIMADYSKKKKLNIKGGGAVLGE